MDTKDTSEGGIAKIAFDLLSQEAGTIVDIGANDGYRKSNSHYFIEMGWKAILVEPTPDYFAKTLELHRKNPGVTCVNACIGEIDGTVTILSHKNDNGNSGDKMGASVVQDSYNRGDYKWVVNMMSVPTLFSGFDTRDITVFSVDAEGFDNQILKSLFSTTIRPKVIIKEVPHTVLDEKIQGVLMQFYGYSLENTIGENHLYVRE